MKQIIRFFTVLCLAAMMVLTAGCEAVSGEAVQEFLGNETVQQVIEAAKAPAADAVQSGIAAISSYVDAAKDIDWNRIAELAGQPTSDILDLLQSKALGYLEDAQDYLGADRSGYGGYYEDILGNRAAMLITTKEDGTIHADITWPAAYDCVELWSFDCTEKESGTLLYSNGTHSMLALNGVSSEETVSTEESGTLRFSEGIAVWTREGDAEPSCLFLIQGSDYPIDGTWEDLSSERAYMEITKSDAADDLYDIIIIWGDSAFESEVWTMTAKWNPDSRSLIYNDCTRMTVTASDASGEQFEQDVHYTGGTGRLMFDGVNLLWIDDTDAAGSECIFSYGG